MPQNPQEVTNPDLVDVADQGFNGLPSPNQPVTTGPSSNPSLATPAVASGPGGGAVANSTNPDLEDVADQGFNGLPRNVFVP